jgi:hypothetical protein
MADETKVVEKKEPSTLSSSLGIDLNSMPKFKNKEAQESFSRNIDVGTKVSQSEADLKKAELEQKTNLLGAEAKVSKDYAQKSREDVEQIESKELEYPRKEFHPTKENAESLGQLFSMVATFGLLVGNSGKLASQNALGAMTGMLKGWQTGRKDLYERELKEFDKEYKRIQDIRTDLQNSLNRLNKLRITDRDAALKEEAYLSAIAGDQSVIGAYAKNKNLQAIQKALDSGEKLDMEVTKIKNQSAQFEKNLQMQRDKMAQKESSSGKGQGLNQRFAFNISEAAQQAGQDLLNITQMPKGTVLGTFSDMTGLGGDSMSKALRNTFTRKITDVEARQFQQLVSGFENNMSRALGGGYANSGAKGAVEAYKQQVARAGDDPIAMATFLARSKQELEILNKQFKAHPGANAEEIKQLDEMMSLINGAVPFNVADVLKATGKGKETVSTATQQMVLPKIPTLQEFLSKAREANPNSSDEDLTNYYNKKYGGQ